jgi:hypothetical protein
LQNFHRAFPHSSQEFQQTTRSPNLLPTIVDGLLKEKRVDLTVLQSDDKWFGVTFKEDVPSVKEAFRQLIADGVYPEKLFG